MEQGLQRRVQVTRVAQVNHARSRGSGTLVADADFRGMAEGDLEKRHTVIVLVTQSFLYLPPVTGKSVPSNERLYCKCLGVASEL